METRSERPTRRALAPSLLCALLLSAPGCHDPLPGEAAGRTITNNVTDWRDEVIYQVLIDRFADGDYGNNYNMDRRYLARYQGGDWQGVIDKIDYFKALGVTTLWISPVVKNVEEDAGFASYHGYWTQDFTKVNPHFGDLAKLQELVDTLHDHGFKVILDIVTNHVGQLFYYDINMNGRPDDILYGGNGPSDGSQNYDLPGRLTRTSEWDPDYDSRGVRAFTSLGESGPAPLRWVYMPEINRAPPQPPEFQDPAWYNRRGRVTVWEYFKTGKDAADKAKYLDQVKGYCNKVPDNDVSNLCDYVRQQELLGDFPGGLKDLRTELADVRAALIKAFKYWITVGDFDGFRIDTLKHVEYGFWNVFCPAMRQHAASLGKQNFLQFGEAFGFSDRLLGSYTGKYDAELMNGVRYPNQVDSVFYFTQPGLLKDIFLYGGAPSGLKDLHDRRLKYYNDRAHPGGIGVPPRDALINFLDNHDIERFLHATQDPVASRRVDWNTAVAGMHGALTYVFTTIGIPNVYYGTEQQFFGGDDPGNREVMWRGNQTRGIAPFDTKNATFQHIAHLADLRRTYAPLRRGNMTIRWATSNTGSESDAGIYAFERTYNGETVLVVLNATRCGKGKATSRTSNGGTTMATAFAPNTALRNVFKDPDDRDKFRVSGAGTVDVEVACAGAKILIKDQ